MLQVFLRQDFFYWIGVAFTMYVIVRVTWWVARRVMSKPQKHPKPRAYRLND